MVRRCIAPNCESTDQKMLCHRFPRKRDLTYKWAESLNVSHIKLEWLLEKYTVCCMHFETSDYRNIESNRLNTTACPKLNPSNPKAAIVQVDTMNNSDTVDLLLCEGDERNEQMVIHNENRIVEEEFIYETSKDDDSSNTSLSTDTEIAFQDDNIEGDIFNEVEDDTMLPENDKSLDDTVENPVGLSEYFVISEIDLEAAKEADDDNVSHEDLPTNPDIADTETQVDVNELERSDSEDAEFRGMSRKDLINMIKEQDEILKEQHKKIEAFQKAHENLLQSIDTFKTLMNV